MGYREAVVGLGLVLAGCSSASTGTEPFAPDAAGDVAPAPDTGSGEADAAPASDAGAPDAKPDGPCVPMTAAEACAGKNCGLVSDGCSGGFMCGAVGGACPQFQQCGLQSANVCGGCEPSDAGPNACQGIQALNGFLVPYTCPILVVDGGAVPFTPGQCRYNTPSLTCCLY